MKPIILGALTALLLCVHSKTCLAQVIRGGGNPYSSQLLTDPDPGNIQGIQQYGRPLATDPAQGTGYPYFVSPTVKDSRGASPFDGRPSINISPAQRLQLQQQFNQIQTAKARAEGSQTASYQQSSGKQLANVGALFKGVLENAGASFGSSMAASTALSRSPIFVPSRPKPDGTGLSPSEIDASIIHQPLIQIKLRVVEVNRNDSLAVSSSLDYIERERGQSTRFDGLGTPNVNNSERNLTGASRFGVDALLDVLNEAGTDIQNEGLAGLNSGSGALVNLTSKQINWVASVLAQEFESDVLTAPELVTTNGQAVEFVAGSREPFSLGSVTTNDNSRLNSFFYKHLGTYIRIKPRIVNYGAFGAGAGSAPITFGDVRDWNQFIRFLLDSNLAPLPTEPSVETTGEEEEESSQKEEPFSKPSDWLPYTKTGRLVPLDFKEVVLEAANQYSRDDLRRYAESKREIDPGFEFDFVEMVDDCGASGCQWKPDDCAIDLEIIARFSGADRADTADALPNDNTLFPTSNDPDLAAQFNSETDVRAVANILQIRNGTGLVMAGLLGESEVDSVAKVPILGDLPLVGALFRSKAVSRVKTELLIFVEAKILTADPSIARAESSVDLDLAAPYVSGGTLDNPLEVGLHRAGFATYLPPPTKGEQQYWERKSRRIRRIQTAARDALR